MNLCPHLTTTTRNVPIELWSMDDQPVRRVAVAPMQTCLLCGASFYLEGVLEQPGTPVVPLAPTPPDNWDC